jgi:hypothetical protein
MGGYGARGKLIHEKHQKQKFSWHCHFKHLAWAQQQWRTQTLSPSIRWPSLEICHTHYEDREKSPGQATLFNIWTIWAMVRTSAESQVNLSLLRGNSLKFQPLGKKREPLPIFSPNNSKYLRTSHVSVSVSLLDRVIKKISKCVFFYPWKDAAGGGNPRMVLVLLVQLCNEWYPVPVGCIHAPWHHKKSPSEENI